MAERVPAAPDQMERKKFARVDSPSAPRARLVRVIPSCTPETTRCKSAIKLSTTVARVSPFATSWRTRERRTATRENSAAAKKPLRATRRRTPMRRTTNMQRGCSFAALYQAEELRHDTLCEEQDVLRCTSRMRPLNSLFHFI